MEWGEYSAFADLPVQMDVAQDLPHIGVAGVDCEYRLAACLSNEGKRLLTVWQDTAP